MKQYLNKDFNAYNVTEINIPDGVIEAALNIYNRFIKTPLSKGETRIDSDVRYSATSPQDWDSDIQWISAYGDFTHAVMKKLFEQSNIAEQTLEVFDVDILRAIQLYSGFFVRRKKCKTPTFHFDYSDTGQNAFTLMTPIEDYSNRKEGHLLYYDLEGDKQTYKYKKGKAVIFGEDFYHATEECNYEEDMIFLCWTYGTDKQEYWDNISATAGDQGAYYVMPNGTPIYV